MGNKKKLRYGRITVIVIVLILGIALIYGIADRIFSSKAETSPAEKSEAQQNQETQAAQQDFKDSAIRYMTFSQEGNIEITVNYLTPTLEDKDTLAFEVSLDTHSVDLTKYLDVRKYVEIKTDSGVTVSDGFEWNTGSNGGHHITGILKLKNDIDGKPVVGSETKSFRLIFKNIGSAGVREHIYDGDKLK